MKTGIIIVLYKTSSQEIERLKLEVGSLKLGDYKIYFVDNTINNRGYAAGVNIGMRKALSDNCELLIVANPDISLEGITAADLLEGEKHFAILGLAMKMHGKVYFGGEIDKWRLSGGLITEKPKNRFSKTDFVSGSLMIIKKEVIDRIGYFDEKYFMYYEDVDFCYRARKAGFKVGIDSERIYEHFEISSFNPRKIQFLDQAGQKFFKKYGNIWQRGYVGFRSDFIINFFSLNLSSLLNKLMHFILFIFLIRYLKLEDYGIYTLVWAQITIFSPIVDLGTTSYGIIHLPTDKKEKFITLFNLRLVVSVIVFFLTILISSFFFKSRPNIITYVFLTSFVIFSNMFSGTYLIQNAVYGKLYYSSLVSLFFNVFLVLGSIISLLIFKSLTVIFIIIFISYNLYSFVNAVLIKNKLKDLHFKIDLKAWFALIKKTYVFVLISLFAGLYFKLDVFLLQFIKGEKEVGVYSAGYKFLEALGFLAASYNISSIPIFARLVRKTPISLLTK